MVNEEQENLAVGDMEKENIDNRVVIKVEGDNHEERRESDGSDSDKDDLLSKSKPHGDLTVTKRELLENTKDCNQIEKNRPVFWKRIAGFGLMLIILKNIISIFADIIVKKIPNIHPVTLILYRSIISLSIAMPWGILQDQPPFPSNQTAKDRVLIVARGVIACLQVMASYFALKQMPLGVQKMILSTRPVFTIIFARFFLKESCGLVECVTIVLMLTGLVLVIKPPFLFTQQLESGYTEWFLLSALLLFLSTAIHSNVSIILRHLRKQSLS